MADAAAIAGTSRRHRARAMSVTELAVSMGILAVLIGMSASLVFGGRRGRAQAACGANLHSIGLAFNYYLGDNRDSYPSAFAKAQWEDLLRPYLPRSVFHCPADNELFSTLGSSYDWRDTGDPATTLAGVPATRVRRIDVCLAYDDFPGWHAPNKVQVLKVDGSVELMDQTAFFKEILRSPTEP